MDCDSLICRDCCVTIHRNHECQFIDEIEDEFGSQLNAQIEVQSQNLSKISNRLDRVRDRKLEFENRTKNIENEVEKYIEEYIHVIRNHGENLKKSIRERRTKQLEEYDEIIEEIQDFEISSEQSIDMAIQAGDIGGSQMLSMLPTIRNRLDQLHSRSKSIKRLFFTVNLLIAITLTGEFIEDDLFVIKDGPSRNQSQSQSQVQGCPSLFLVQHFKTCFFIFYAE